MPPLLHTHLRTPPTHPAGEAPWQRRMIDAYHSQAAAKGVRLVTGCGMESVPPDVGTFVLARYMKERLGRCRGAPNA